LSESVSSGNSKTWWQGDGVVCLLLALVTLGVFLPVGWHDFVNYDDSDYVTANAHVQTGLKWSNVTWAFVTGHASNWHPLTWLSHMLDCQLFGQRAGAHHLVSVGFHILNTLLLFMVFRRMTGALWRSAFVAAVFALHPLHVESVAWASERKDVLSGCFFLLTLWAYAGYAKARERRGDKVMDKVTDKVGAGPPLVSGQWSVVSGPSSLYSLALVCFTLGLMSKPMLVTLPFVLLLLDYWPLGRLQLSTANEPESRKRKDQDSPVPPPPLGPGPVPLQRLLLEKVPFFALCVASSVVTFIVQRKGGAVSTSISLGARVANALVSYARYLSKMFWPQNLSVLYPHPGHWPTWQPIAAGALLLVVFAAVLVLARKAPYLAMGWLWFCGSLVPVIGLVQVGIQSMADRYMYLPMIGLLIMVVWGLCELLPLWPWRPTAFGVAAALSLAVCGLLTVRQLGYWRDSETLFTRAVEVTPNNYLAYNNLGYYLSGQKKIEDALKNYRKALAINPNYEDALNNLGYALAGQKKYGEAIGYYQAALRVRPGHVEVHNNLGNALSETGDIDGAIQHYRFVLEHNPEHADAHNNLGIALAMQGKLAEAIPHFRDAIRFKPNYASAHSNLGNALAAERKFDEAIKEYQESLRLNPKDAQAHNNLANALTEQGRVDEAVGHYQEALRLNTDNPEAHFNLALALARQGKREAALAHFTEALRLKPDYAAARQQLDALKAQPAQ
jgi:protein O-mannosyl-transferase